MTLIKALTKYERPKMKRYARQKCNLFLRKRLHFCGAITWNNLFMSFEVTFHQKLKQQNTKLERTKNRIRRYYLFLYKITDRKKSYLHVEMKRKIMSINDLNQETFSCRMEHISFRNCWSMILPSGSESKEALLYSYFGDMNWGGSRKKKKVGLRECLQADN